MSKLTEKHCVPCEGGVPRLTEQEYTPLLGELGMEWLVVDGIKLTREFTFENYADVIEFTNRIAAIAENEGHHPVLHLYFSKVEVEIWTHAILGLSENDFILASKIEQLN